MNPVIEISTELGTIAVELNAAAAPGTVSNFLRFIDNAAYTNGRFYRTVTPLNQPDDTVRIAVIQGGIAETFDAEPYDSLPLERTNLTGLKHLDGTISMARREPDSARTEFFICVGDQPELDFGGRRNPDGQGFAAFGQVVEGADVVRAINAAPHEAQQLIPPIGIASITLRSQ